MENTRRESSEMLFFSKHLSTCQFLSSFDYSFCHFVSIFIRIHFACTKHNNTERNEITKWRGKCQFSLDWIHQDDVNVDNIYDIPKYFLVFQFLIERIFLFSKNISLQSIEFLDFLFTHLFPFQLEKYSLKQQKFINLTLFPFALKFSFAKLKVSNCFPILSPPFHYNLTK